MTQEQKNHIQQLAKEHFRYSFSHIKAKADSKGAHLEAYYLFLVDDFFAVGDAAISREAIKAYDPNASIVEAIWSGECEEDYDGSYVPVQKNTDNWLDNQSHLYKETYLPQADADKTVTADVSAAALPFFKKQGFILQHQNQIQRNGSVLINYRMILQTDSIDAAAQTTPSPRGGGSGRG